MAIVGRPSGFGIFDEMTDLMQRAYILGWPVKHSRSPKIHGYWLKQLGLEGSYELCETPPDTLADTVAVLKAQGFAGANVTVPHKEAIFALCDTVTSQAKSVGAVNTLWLEGGILHGDNTDLYGFSQNLKDFAPQWQSGKTAMVLGAGGAARAILYALVQNKYDKILLVNRNLERAQKLAALWPDQVTPLDWAVAQTRLKETDLLINATSLGMHGQPPLLIDLASANPTLIVNDIVYVPMQTNLLKQAKDRGLTAIDGLGMLLNQAVPGFSRWFGHTPQVTPELRMLIARDIPE